MPFSFFTQESYTLFQKKKTQKESKGKIKATFKPKKNKPNCKCRYILKIFIKKKKMELIDRVDFMVTVTVL